MKGILSLVKRKGVDSSLRRNDIRERCDAGVTGYRLSPVLLGQVLLKEGDRGELNSL